MSYCENCGHPSHCGVPLYSQSRFDLADDFPSNIKLCDHCRCKECCKHKCSKCNEYKVCDAMDYRDEYWGKLRGQMWVCKDCQDEASKD